MRLCRDFSVFIHRKSPRRTICRLVHLIFMQCPVTFPAHKFQIAPAEQDLRIMDSVRRHRDFVMNDLASRYYAITQAALT